MSFLDFLLIFRKSTPDQYAAISKRTISRSLNAGYDCNSAMQMAESILRFGPLSNVVIFVGKMINNTSKETNKIEGITQYHDFEFAQPGVIARCQSSIGIGKRIELKPVKHTPEFEIDKSFQETILKRQVDESGNPTKRSSLKFISRTETDDFKDESGRHGRLDSNQTILNEYDTVFTCPNGRCSLEFLTLNGKLLSFMK